MIRAKTILYTITLLLFSFFILLPLLYILLDSFIKDGNFTLANYKELLTTGSLSMLLDSLQLSSIVATISTTIGILFAFLSAKSNLVIKPLYKVLFLAPLFISPYILTLSWVDFFILFDGGKGFIYSFWGVVWVLSFIFVPLSVVIISSGFSHIDAKLEEAGLMLASYPYILFYIILPLIRPSIISSFILIFVLSISEFSVAMFLSVEVLTTEIFREFSAFYDYSLAIANSMILLLIAIVLLIGERGFLAKASFLSVGSRTHRSRVVDVGEYRYIWIAIFGIYIILSIVTPLSMLIFQSFQGGLDTIYRAISLLTPHIIDTLLYALIGASVLTLFGAVFASLVRYRGRGYIDVILLISFAVPSTVLGIGLIKFFNRESLDFIYSSFWIIIIAYLGKFIFISYKLISNALTQIPLSLEESATLMGASFWVRTREIILPLIADTLFLTFIIGFILSLGELGATILVYPAGSSVMGIKLFTIMANAPTALVSAMSLVILVVTMVALILLLKLFSIVFGSRE